MHLLLWAREGRLVGVEGTTLLPRGVSWFVPVSLCVCPFGCPCACVLVPVSECAFVLVPVS